MRITRSIVFPLALGATLSACASAGPRADRLTKPTGGRDSYVIEGTSVRGERMLLDVVASQWPRLVSGDLPRGDAGQATSMDRFAVYDARGAFLGGPDYLASVRARDVRAIRRLTALEEAAKFGKRHPAGAVVIDWGAGRR